MSALREDIRRMLPVWIIVLASAVATLLVLRHTGTKFLREGLLRGGDACTVGEMHARAGERIFRRLLEEAEARRRDALAKDPAAISRAMTGILKGDPRVRQARAHFEQGVRLCPTLAYLHRDLATLAEWDGDRARAHLHLGLASRAESDRDQARAEFTLAAAADPSLTEAQLALAESMLDDGDTDEARDLLASLPPAARETSRGAVVAGRIAITDRQYDAAATLLAEALRRDPTNADLNRQLGVALDNLRDWPRAGALYSEIARLPNAAGAQPYHRAGIYFLRAGKYAEAERELAQAARIAPRNVAIQYDYALSLWHQKKYAAARDAYRAAQEVDFEAVIRLKDRTGIDPSVPAGS
jgi:tetratricopeptide (TPR) repeat protein